MCSSILAVVLAFVLVLGNANAAENDTITLLGPRIVVTIPPGSCIYVKQPGHEIPFRLCFDSILELSPDGTAVSSYSFPSLSWLRFTSNFTTATANAVIPNGAVVSLSAILFTSDQVVKLGNVSFFISGNDLMWRVELLSWPFQSMNNSVAVNWTMSHPSFHAWSLYNASTPYPSRTLRLSAYGIPDWKIAIFDYCLADNNFIPTSPAVLAHLTVFPATHYNVTMDAWVQSSTNESRLDAQITFPSFTNNMRFLSTTWIESPVTSTSKGFIGGVAAVSLVIILLTLGVGVFLPHFLRKRDYSSLPSQARA